MNLIDPRKLKIINSLPPKASAGDKISIDSEFFGQEKKRLHRPHGTFAFLGCSFDGETVYYITDESQIHEFYNHIEAGVHIYHNAKYDIRQLRKYTHIPQRRKLWDTMLIEQIMYSGYYTDFALADLVRRYLDTYMSKETRAEFSEWNPETFERYSEMTQDQINYSCADVAYTWKVYRAQKEKISEDDIQIWKEIELPFLWVLLSMGGVKLDKEKWIDLAERTKNTAQEIQDKYGHWTQVQGKKSMKDVFEGINLNSPAQVKAHLQTLGYRTNTTNAEYLDSISDDCEFAKDMCVYRVYAKRSSTYGEEFVNDYVESDGKIYADIYQIGAETGRTSCRQPNLQNQPHEVAYRECFIADKGEVMVVADWGAQEPRFAAYFSQDEKLMDALNSEEKLYVRIGREALGIDITKEDPEYKHLKSTVLGLFYGMSAKGLAKRIGVTEDEAQDMIDAILETYPGIKEYMKNQKKAKDYVTSVYGRKIWLNKYSNQWERNALNAPIQSSAADAMKIAAYWFTVNWCGEDFYDNTPLRLLVHDEIAIAIPAEKYKDAESVLQESMINTAEEMHDGIKGSIEIFHGENWACKH